jgi:hypothetical protein
VTAGLALPLLCSSLGLHLSLEADPRPGASFPVHLSAHGLGSVEVVLTVLPSSPDQPIGSPGSPGYGELRSPPLLLKAAALRDGIASTYRELHGALTPTASALAHDLLGQSRPLGALLREAPDGQSRVPPGEVKAAWRVDPSERGWNEFDLDIGPLQPGLYRLDAHRDAERTEIRVVVTDLSLLVVRDTAGATVLATRSSSGEGVADVEVFARTQGHPVSLGKTGSQGMLVTHGSQAVLDSAGIGSALWGQHGDLLARAVLPPPAITLPPESGTAAMFLDRRHYAPGDTVHLWAIPRDIRSGIVGERTLSIPDSNRVVLSLLDGEGRVLWQRAFEASALGVVAADVDLPVGLLLGDYTLAMTWGEQRHAVGFSVDSEVAPEVQASLRLPNRQAFTVNVTDRLNRPMPQAWVHWWALRLPSATSPGSGDEVAPLGPFEVLAAGDGITGEAGSLEVHLPKPVAPRARVLAQVEVQDPAGRVARVEGDLPPASSEAIALRLRPERLLVRPGRSASLSVDARAFDSSPLHVKLEALLRPVVEGPGGEPQKKDPFRRTLETDARGHAALTLPAFSPGYVEIELGVEGQPASAQALVFVTELGGDIPTTPDRLLVVPELPEHRRAQGPHGTASVEEQRVLIMTPFESGTVLLTTEPPTAGPPLVAVIHGYSGVAHLHPTLTASGLYLSAAAMRGGRFFQQWVQLVPPFRAPGLLVRGSFERPPRAGQHALLTLQTEDGAGRSLPSEVLGRLSLDGDGSAPLADQLHPPYAPSAAFSSSQAGWEPAQPPSRRFERSLTPYGPSRWMEPFTVPSEAVSFVVQTGATGRGQQGLTLPSSWPSSSNPGATGNAILALRAVAGPDQLGETSHEIQWISLPRLAFLSPPWARQADELIVGVQLRGDQQQPSAVCAAEVAVGGTAVAVRCDAPEGRASAVVKVEGNARSLDLVATLLTGSAGRLSDHQEIPIQQPPAQPSNPIDLAHQLARALAQPEAGEEQADLACAAIRALGGVIPGDQKLDSAALVRLGQLERPEGGFGADVGELRRDLAALEGLTALHDWVDPGLLNRTLTRVRTLATRLDEDQRRARWLPDARGKAQPVRGVIDPRGATALELSHRLGARRSNRRGASGGLDAESSLRRLLILMTTADVLDLAEIAVALRALPEALRIDTQTVEPVIVERRYQLLHHSGWTEALLVAGEEPPEPTESPLGSAPIPLGAEVSVTLSAELDNGGLHCIREQLPGTLAPIGLASSAVRDGSLLLCGEPRDGRLSVEYSARVLYVGRFHAPAAVAGPVELGRPTVSDIVEVAP